MVLATCVENKDNHVVIEQGTAALNYKRVDLD